MVANFQLFVVILFFFINEIKLIKTTEKRFSVICFFFKENLISYYISLEMTLNVNIDMYLGCDVTG